VAGRPRRVHRARHPVLEQELAPVAVLGIDETRRGKPIWGRTRPPAGCGWRTTGGTRPLWTLPEPPAYLRTSMDAPPIAWEWPKAQPDSWKEQVTHVTIDLSASYAKAVRDALPDTVIVAVKFHVVALGNQMLTEVRQHAIRAARGLRGPKKDPEWAARRGCFSATNATQVRSSPRCGTP